MKNMKRLEREGARITLPGDDKGFTGRLCPSASCRGYFKVKFGTGLPGQNPCVCPYCGHKADHHAFTTPDQERYIKSYAKHLITSAVLKDLKGVFRPRTFDSGFIKITTTVRGQPEPIRRYREKELETYATCTSCTLEYAVYGAFAFCPDCGEHNSLAILEQTFVVIEKMLALAAQVDADVAGRIIGNALEDAVAAFDGFGREVVRRAAPRATSPSQAEKMSFQNLTGAETNLAKLFGVSLMTAVRADEWKAATVSFQKRHLLAHKMGVVDESYVAATGEPGAMKGRIVPITPEDVASLIGVLRKLAVALRASLA